MVKSITLAVCGLLLLGCSASANLKRDELKPMEQPGFYISPVLIYPYQAGFFATVNHESDALYYFEDGQEPVFVSEMSFINDKPYKEALGEEVRYSDRLLLTQICVYDEHLVYTTSYTNSDGESHCRVFMMNPDGSERKELASLPEIPVYFAIHRDRIITVHYDENFRYHLTVRDLSGKVLNEWQNSGLIMRPVCDGEYLYVGMGDPDRILRLSLEDGSEQVLFEDRFFVFENMGLVSSYAFTDGSYLDSKITDMEGNTVFKAEDNQILDYYDEQYVYVTDRTTQIFSYLVYDWDGNLIREFHPQELGIQTFASNIARVVNGCLISEYWDENAIIHLISCNIDTGEMKFLN